MLPFISLPRSKLLPPAQRSLLSCGAPLCRSGAVSVFTCPGMPLSGGEGETNPVEGSNQGSGLDLKGKKGHTGARARSIKTPLQREALEAAFLSELY